MATSTTCTGPVDHRAVALGLLLTFAFLSSSCGGTAQLNRPTSREAKLLLHPANFEQRQEGFQAYWGRVVELAATLDIGIKPVYLPYKERHRQVVFLDTEDFAIRATGYILRERIKFKNGELQEKRELALKYRSTELAESQGASTYAPDYKAETELEEDLSIKEIDPDAGLPYQEGTGASLKRWEIKRIFALRTKLKTREQFEPTLGEYAKVFPVLAQLAIPLDSPLLPVNGIVIHEVSCNIGKLDFGDGLVATATLTLWYSEAMDPLIAEFSFDHPIPDPIPEEATRRLEDFYLFLYHNSGGWIELGSTKTSFTYGHKASQ